MPNKQCVISNDFKQGSDIKLLTGMINRVMGGMERLELRKPGRWYALRKEKKNGCDIHVWDQFTETEEKAGV